MKIQMSELLAGMCIQEIENRDLGPKDQNQLVELEIRIKEMLVDALSSFGILDTEVDFLQQIEE